MAVLVWSVAVALVAVFLIWRTSSANGEGPWFGLLVGALIVAGGALWAAGLQ